MDHKDGHNAASDAMEAFEQRMQEMAGEEDSKGMFDSFFSDDPAAYWIYSSLSSWSDEGFLLQLDLHVSTATDTREAYIVDGDVGIEYGVMASNNNWGGMEAPDEYSTVKLYSSVYSAPEPTISEGVAIAYASGFDRSGENPFFGPFESDEFEADPNADKVSVNVMYGNEEYSRIRDRFSAPEGSTFASLIEEAVSNIVDELDLTIVGRASNKRVSMPKQFGYTDLFAIATVEGSQDVSVSLTTVTGSAGVTSTSVYSAGSGYR